MSTFKYVGPEWPKGVASGWEHESVGLSMRRKWGKFENLTNTAQPFAMVHDAPDAFLHVPRVEAHNQYMTFAYVLARALLLHPEKLTVLDWGGGAGHYARIARKLYPDSYINYTVLDHRNVCDNAYELWLGVTLDQSAHFIYAKGDGISFKTNLVIANGTVHYNPNWRECVAEVMSSACDLVYIGSARVLHREPSYVCVEDATAHGYMAPLYSWCVNEREFLSRAEIEELKLIREFYMEPALDIEGAPERPVTKGYLFSRK